MDYFAFAPEFLEKKDILDDAWTSAAIEAYEFEQELLSQCCDEDDFIAMEDMAPYPRIAGMLG